MLKVSIFMAKMRKPIIPKLVVFMKSQKLVRNFKVNLVQNHKKYYYNYGYITDYEFSPSKTHPLIGYQRKQKHQNQLGFGISLQRVYSMLFLCNNFPAVDEEIKVNCGALDWDDHDEEEEEEEEEEEDDGSIDLRAEKFIERFYEEMKMQRQVSL
ncbi:hypothetical protein F8388_015125 [Cannabis sativa]|uniref:Cotton fiber protein n=1 Tax=Cannabis sativa TaxID=3483 RepID=A0A7J6EQV5_CANSA|nr:hypothetical protein F8388_015125 [Cannabis sativa]KAF4395377.1 hypothetical protein G4B88_010841 [Cannabis sativa]